MARCARGLNTNTATRVSGHVLQILHLPRKVQLTLLTYNRPLLTAAADCENRVDALRKLLKVPGEMRPSQIQAEMRRAASYFAGMVHSLTSILVIVMLGSITGTSKVDVYHNLVC